MGHGRWKCPLPRDALDESGQHIKFDNTGNKYAACGPESGKWGFGSVTTLSPGWTTLTWEESISHHGSPFRIAILDENEVAKIVLLDHIPHDDASSPNYMLESTFTQYKMSVEIPNVKCEKCSLQFLYVMTDKTTNCNIQSCFYNPVDAACKGSVDPNAKTCAGAPNDNICVQEGECFSNYHSCTDVIITGEKPIDQFNLDNQPNDWPFNSAHFKMQYYTTEVGEWKNGWLQNIPSNYTQSYSSLTC
eukprot:gene10852-14569_t